jgi:hypothetical protein
MNSHSEQDTVPMYQNNLGEVTGLDPDFERALPADDAYMDLLRGVDELGTKISVVRESGAEPNGLLEEHCKATEAVRGRQTELAEVWHEVRGDSMAFALRLGVDSLTRRLEASAAAGEDGSELREQLAVAKARLYNHLYT